MQEENKNFLSSQPHLREFRVLDYDNIYSQYEHKSHSHELLYVLDGRMTLHLAGNLKFQAMPGDFLLVPSEVPHRDEFARMKGLRIMILQFVWEEEEYFRIVNNLSLSNLSYEARTECRRRLEFMRAHWHNTLEDKLHGSIQLHGILMLFYFDLLKVSDSPAPAAGVPMKEAMRRAKHFLDENFMDQVSLKQTARYIGISPAYLSRVFHHEYGVSFTQYLTAIRLAAAKELLQSTRLQIAEVAARCGFASSSYFIKVFSDHYGVTPKNYAGEKGRTDVVPHKKRPVTL